MLTRIVCFVLIFVTISESVKIGISKPVTLTENATTEIIETTTPETTTVTTFSTSTTTKKVQMTSTTPKITAKTTQTTKTTISTTTPIPSSTSTATTLSNDTKLSSVRGQQIDHSGYYCSCDVKRGFCDINCCCDIDCIPEELNSFDCQIEKYHLEDFHDQQGLPPCKINEGWLCVIRTNIVDNQRKEINILLNPLDTHEWPQLIPDTNDIEKNRNYYKIGEPILMFNLEENEVIEFDIPFSIVGQSCDIYESIRHLSSRKTSCEINEDKAKFLEATLFQKLSTSLVLTTPNIRIPLDGIVKDTQTEFIPITLYRCIDNIDCIPTTLNSTSFDSFDDEFVYSSEIQTRIEHNITNLLNCEVYFIRSGRKSDRIWQHYVVNFVHINETNRGPSNVSGPLGYRTGGALIIGHKVVFNESADHTDSNRIINYFHPNRTDEAIHIYIPRRRQDQCEMSQSTVNFGESILVQCSIQLDNSTELNSETNFTKICEDLQNKSFKIWQLDEVIKFQEEYFVSVLGFPENNTEKWVKIEVNHYEHLPVVGLYLGREDAFICQNMILGLNYEILTIAKHIQGVPHQNIIEKATIKVGKRHDLQFQLDEIISMPITFSVIFKDIRELNCAKKYVSTYVIFLSSFYVFIKL